MPLWVVINKTDVLGGLWASVGCGKTCAFELSDFGSEGRGTHYNLRTPLVHLFDLFLTVDALCILENREFMEGSLCLWDLTMNQVIF